ncbi:hypothetical protein CE91St44_06230 [Oscillospiraceae bacterium]|uniref:hypothetical protein n=1 Tax=Allofournierella sp. TaxID=1940256 RepID=UPI0015A78F07|nr:hypothetical protein CE91St44_06230 [Oscillospiraceae bacterium]
MLIKLFSCPAKNATLEEYKAALRRRVRLFCGLSVLGVLTLAVTLLLMGGRIAEAHDTAHLEGIWCGIGVGLTLAGAVLAARTRALLNNEEKLRRTRLEEQDERNQAVFARALNLTAFTLLFGLYVAMLVSSFFNMTVFYTLFYCAVSAFVLLAIFRAICSRSM